MSETLDAVRVWLLQNGVAVPTHLAHKTFVPDSFEPDFSHVTEPFLSLT